MTRTIAWLPCFVGLVACAALPRSEPEAGSPGPGRARAARQAEATARLAALPAEAGGTELVSIHHWQGRWIEEYRFPNGLTLLLIPETDDRRRSEPSARPQVSYQTWFGAGSAHEYPGITGTAHLLEHIMFRPAIDGSVSFDERMAEIGGTTEAATWRDWTLYITRAAPEHLDRVAAAEADRLRHRIIDEDALHRERALVLAERRERVETSAGGRMREALYKLAFRRHPYGWPTEGRRDDLESLRVADVRRFHRAHYNVDNATVLIAGPFDPDRGLALVWRHYGGLPVAAGAPDDADPEPPQTAPRERTIPLSVDAPRLLVGFRQPAVTHPDHAAVEVLDAILFGADGRIQTELGTSDDRVEAIDSGVARFKYEGLYEISLSLAPDAPAGEIAERLDERLAAVAERPPSDSELADARAKLEARLAEQVATPEGLARVLGHYQMTAGSHVAALQLTQARRQVTAADVQRVAASLFRPENRTRIIGRPE